jgi:NAD(P)H-flavin reductase
MDNLKQSGEIIEKELIAKDTFRLRVKCSGFDFQPGQFVSIEISKGLRRSYSISSIPNKEYFELIADTIHGGPGSEFFKKAKVGDKINFMGPLGRLIYVEESSPVYFFATGTGAVPFLSMIGYALENLKTKREISFYLGFRYEEQIFAADYLKNLEKKYPNFKLTLTLTRPDESWKGKSGRITEYFKEIKNAGDSSAYLCGSRDMVTDVNQKLLDIGFQKERVHFEKY